MSTRATYCFDCKGYKTTVYIHHDGYPEGAAAYFYNTLIKSSKGNFATQFIRANEGAELTRSHDQHGDTDFQYNIKGSGPEAEITAYQLTGDEKAFVFSGTIFEFIHRYSKYLQNYNPFKIVKMGYLTKMLNLETAEKELEYHVHHLRVWKGKFEGSGNWNSCVQDTKIILEIFPELKTEEMASFGIC